MSPAGSSPESLLFKTNSCKWEESGTDYSSKVIWLAVSTVATLITLSFTMGVVRCFLVRRKGTENRLSEQETCKALTESRSACEFTSDCSTSFEEEKDEYMIHKERLQMCCLLGEGEFGVVHKAILKSPLGHTTQVAVKTFKGNSRSEETALFEKEVELMKTAGNHKNIVGLVGYDKDRRFLVIEYCPLGDLLNYLRRSVMETNSLDSNFMQTVPSDYSGQFGKVSEAHGRNMVSNPLYQASGACNNECIRLKTTDLISFARQVAVGMQYLSESRVVHRDLAARNVLVCADMAVKISDFGLSRDIYCESVYTKKTSSRVPIKWMAVESLSHQIFTTQSDVWSFGVLLWEILTLGGCPYPSIPTAKIYKFLREGHRMEKPPGCSQQLYEVMLSCWNLKPFNRPSFLTLVKKLETIMEDLSPNRYTQLEPEQEF